VVALRVVAQHVIQFFKLKILKTRTQQRI
jgi:hypothetical protein